MTSASNRVRQPAGDQDAHFRPPDIAERVHEIAEELEGQAEEFRLFQDMTRLVMSDIKDLSSTIEYCLRRICESQRWTVGHAVVVFSDLPQVPSVGHIWHLTRPEVEIAFCEAAERIHKERDGQLWMPSPFHRCEVAVLSDLQSEPQFVPHKAATDAGLRSAAFVPVLLEEQVPAYLEFFSREPMEVRPGTKDLLTCVAALISQTIQRAILEKAVSDSSWFLQQHVGRELHDSVCQDLVGLAFLSRKLGELFASEKSAHAPLVRELTQGIDTVLERSRAISQGLSPIECDAAELPQALRDLVNCTRKRFSVHMSLDCPKKLRLRDDNQSRDLYFIGHEGLSNAVKHSRASNIHVALLRQNGSVVLKIEDDGVGLSQKPDASGGIGLRVMHFRAANLGAKLELNEREGGGTVLTCSLPYEELDHDSHI